MDGEADAVICQAVLREVVGADLLAAVAGLYHRASLFGERFLLLLHLDLVQTGPEHAHAFFAVLDLGFFVLATDHGVGRNVRDADGGVRRIHRLTARARGAKRVDAQIFRFDFDIDIFGFRQHCDSDGGSVNPSLLLGGGDPLYTVNSAFIFQLRVHAVAFDDRNDFFQTADRGFRRREYLDLPALSLGIARVHSEDFGGEKRRFVSASPGADFEDDVLFVVRIFGDKKDLEFLFDDTHALLQAIQFFLRIRAHVGVFLVR